jgi:hypothetical protein
MRVGSPVFRLRIVKLNFTFECPLPTIALSRAARRYLVLRGNEQEHKPLDILRLTCGGELGLSSLVVTTRHWQVTMERTP